MKDRSDSELVGLVVEADDRAAFGELVERHKRGVFALLHRILGRNEEIEDIAQNIFLAAYRGLKAFRQSAKFSTWLFRITYNHACTALRRYRTKREQMTVPHEEDEKGQLKEYEDTKGLNPESSVLNKQVWAAVDRLPVQSRAVIELYYGRGLSYPEIAESLSLPLGTVKTHLHRARGKLRELLVENPQAAES